MTDSAFYTDGAAFQADAEDPLSEQVVQAVAEETGADPLEMNPLYEAINPDCLDSLFKTTDGGLPRNIGEVTFRYFGCEVTVTSAGEVRVTSPEVATAAEAEASTGN